MGNRKPGIGSRPRVGAAVRRLVRELGLVAEDEDCAALLADARALTRAELREELGWTSSRLERSIDRIRWRLRGDGDADLGKRLLLCAIGWRGSGAWAVRREPIDLCLRGLDISRVQVRRMDLPTVERRFLAHVLHPDKGKRAFVARELSRKQGAVLKLAQRVKARFGSFRRGQVALETLGRILEGERPRETHTAR